MRIKGKKKTETKQVALIETGGSHDECLYSQIAALKLHNYKVHLVTDEKTAKRIGETSVADYSKILSFGKSWWNDWKSLFAIRNYLRKNKIQKAVINTAEGKLIRNLCFIIGADTEVIGVLHNGRKLIKSGTQKMISMRIKKYFVLNDYILASLKDVINDINIKIKLASFYPVFFPQHQTFPLTKSKDEFWVCIPGQVEFKRRDYKGLLNSLTNRNRALSKKIKFILLGNGSHPQGNGKEVKAMVKEIGLEEHFIFFDTFISNDIYYAYLSASDVIMPLIHPETDGFENYLHYQISGTYNLAFGFAKPMLVHDAFNKIEDLRLTSWFYKTEEEIVEKLEMLSAQREILKQKQAEITSLEKFSLEYQSRKYVDFIELEVGR